MSYVLTAATKVHETQLALAGKGQEILVKVGERIAGLSERTPQAPQAVQNLLEPLHRLTEPLRKVVGERSEYQAYVKQSTRDWLKVQHQFADQLVAMMPGTVPAPKAAKTGNARNGSANKSA